MSALFHLIFGWFGIATLIGVAAVAVAVFSVWIGAMLPGPLTFMTAHLRHYAILVAIAAFSFTAISGKFYNDGLKFKQGQWDAAVQAAIERGEAARSDAERDVGNGSGGAGGLSDDKLDRDKSPM